MNKALRIAITELKILFFSPIAWLLLIVFIIQTGLKYTDYLSSMDMSMQLKYKLDTITYRMFVDPMGGLFPVVVRNLYMYIPLLTMGLISREVSSGSVKLLYSSPVRIRDIVLGKFTAMVVYSLMLIVFLSPFAFSGWISIQHADGGMLLSGLLGIFLLLCTYSAIGIFLSCLTSYQVVAAICTFAVFALLNYIGMVWQDYDFFRDLTWFLSIAGRTDTIINGLITTREFLYFGLIMVLFLGMTWLKLKDERYSRPFGRKVLNYLLLFSGVLTVGYFSSRPGWIGYYDASAGSPNTITVNSQQVVQELKDPLEITTYVNLLDNTFYSGLPRMRNQDLDRWEAWQRFKPDIKLKYVYYYDSSFNTRGDIYKENPGKTLREIAETRAKAYDVGFFRFKTPEEIRKIVDVRSEGNIYVMQLKYRNRTTFLRVFADQTFWPMEAEISAAFKRLTDTLPKIAFLTGDLERNTHMLGDREYNKLTRELHFRNALINRGFDVEDLSMDGTGIPQDITALVIADPKKDLGPAKLDKIRTWLSEGGNLLIATEPGNAAICQPILNSIGVRTRLGTMVQQSAGFAPDFLLPYLTPGAGRLTRFLRDDFEDSTRVPMPGASALAYSDTSGFVITPLLYSDPRHSWNRSAGLSPDSSTISWSPAPGDEKGAFPTALALTRSVRGKEQRIIVTGDADFMSNTEIYKSTQGEKILMANLDFNEALFSWLCYGKFPIDVYRKKAPDTLLSSAGSAILLQKILLLAVIPGILLIIGSVLLIRRKRK